MAWYIQIRHTVILSIYLSLSLSSDITFITQTREEEEEKNEIQGVFILCLEFHSTSLWNSDKLLYGPLSRFRVTIASYLRSIGRQKEFRHWSSLSTQHEGDFDANMSNLTSKLQRTSEPHLLFFDFSLQLRSVMVELTSILCYHGCPVI